MASKIKLKNINGKEISVINPDTNTKDREVDISRVTQYVADRAELQAKTGILGDVVLQKDIALAYEWVEPQQTGNDGTIINSTNNTTGSWKALYSGAVNVKWFGSLSVEASYIKAAAVTTDSIYVPAGSYTLDANTVDFSAVKFHSDGDVTISVNTTIVVNSNIIKANTYEIMFNYENGVYSVVNNKNEQITTGNDLANTFNTIKQLGVFTNGTCIKFPSGYHATTTTFDMTNIRDISVTFLLDGCTIIAKNTDTPVFNLTASHLSLNFYGGLLIGDSTLTPSYGILMARGADGNSAGNHRFFGTQISGSFSKSSIYLLTSEANLFYGTLFKNFTSNAHAMTIAREDILGTSSQFGVTPTASCCTTMNSVFGGYLDAEGTGGAALFIYGNVESFSVSSTYVHTTDNAGSGYQDGAIVLQGNSKTINFDNVNIEGGAKYGIRFYNTATTVVDNILFNNMSIFNSSGSTSDRHIYADSYSALNNFKIPNIGRTLSYGFESAYYIENLYINDPSANLGSLIFSRTANPFYGYCELLVKDFTIVSSSYYPTASSQYLKISTKDGVKEYKKQTQPFIDVYGTTASDNTGNISTGTPTSTTKKYIKIDIDGTSFWVLAESWE